MLDPTVDVEVGIEWAPIGVETWTPVCSVRHVGDPTLTSVAGQQVHVVLTQPGLKQNAWITFFRANRVRVRPFIRAVSGGTVGATLDVT